MCIVRTRHVCLCVFVRPRVCPCICFAAPVSLHLVVDQPLQQVSSSRRAVARYFAQMVSFRLRPQRSGIAPVKWHSSRREAEDTAWMLNWPPSAGKAARPRACKSRSCLQAAAELNCKTLCPACSLTPQGRQRQSTGCATSQKPQNFQVRGKS